MPDTPHTTHDIEYIEVDSMQFEQRSVVATLDRWAGYLMKALFLAIAWPLRLLWKVIVWLGLWAAKGLKNSVNDIRKVVVEYIAKFWMRIFGILLALLWAANGFDLAKTFSLEGLSVIFRAFF